MLAAYANNYPVAERLPVVRQAVRHGHLGSSEATDTICDAFAQFRLSDGGVQVLYDDFSPLTCVITRNKSYVLPKCGAPAQNHTRTCN